MVFDMLKKYLFLCAVLCGITNAYAEGVVLSDTYVAGEEADTAIVEEEPFVAPQTTNTDTYSSSSKSNSYIGQQIKPATKSSLYNDSSDPLFLIPDNKFLSDSYITTVDKKLRFGQFVGYGINNNFVLHANMLYQWDLSGEHQNGFSSTEFGGTYRMNHGSGANHIISDALFGLKIWGSSHVRTPEYADSSYYAGLRFGRQYTGVTLAGTVKSTWVFDNDRGLSYVDFIPEAYFRLKYDWRMGMGLDFRKSTNTRFLPDQEWLNLKLLRQYGNTQYIGKIDYEFEDEEYQFGFDVKILF